MWPHWALLRMVFCEAKQGHFMSLRKLAQASSHMPMDFGFLPTHIDYQSSLVGNQVALNQCSWPRNKRGKNPRFSLCWSGFFPLGNCCFLFSKNIQYPINPPSDSLSSYISLHPSTSSICLCFPISVLWFRNISFPPALFSLSASQWTTMVMPDKNHSHSVSI